MHSSGAATGGTRPLTLATAAMVLVPYATLTLPFRRALLVQAGALLVLLAALALWQALKTPEAPLRAWRQRPSWWRWGLGLWAGATVLGTLVGLLRDNPPAALAGQLLSLAFLPLGAFAVAATPALRESFRQGLVGATVAASLFHFGQWLATGATGGERYRFFLANDVSVAGIALLALLLALAPLPEGGRRRLFALAACLVLALFVFGAGVRGLWLVVPPAWLLFRLLSGERSGLGLRVVAAAAALLAGAGLITTLHLARGFPNRLPSESPGVPLRGDLSSHEAAEGEPRLPVVTEWRAGEPAQAVLETVGPFEPGAWRLTATLKGGERHLATVVLRFVDDDGVMVGSVGFRARPQGTWSVHRAFGTLERAAPRALLEVGSLAEATGTWQLSKVRLERVGPLRLAPWLGQVDYSRVRLHSTWLTLAGDPRALDDDPSVGLRLLESRTLWREVRSARLPDLLFGAGLGAHFELPAEAAARLGASALPRNYVHNFYLFLPFKLGLLGTAAVLAALVLLVGGLAWASLVQPPGEERRFLAAAAAALAGYAVLSVSSPELLNFRVTPLLGLLLGVAGAAIPRSASSSR